MTRTATNLQPRRRHSMTCAGMICHRGCHHLIHHSSTCRSCYRRGGRRGSRSHKITELARSHRWVLHYRRALVETAKSAQRCVWGGRGTTYQASEDGVTFASGLGHRRREPRSLVAIGPLAGLGAREKRASAMVTVEALEVRGWKLDRCRLRRRHCRWTAVTR